MLLLFWHFCIVKRCTREIVCNRKEQEKRETNRKTDIKNSWKRVEGSKNMVPAREDM